MEVGWSGKGVGVVYTFIRLPPFYTLGIALAAAYRVFCRAKKKKRYIIARPGRE